MIYVDTAAILTAVFPKQKRNRPPKPAPPAKAYKISEVAALLNVSPKTAVKIFRGLGAIKVGGKKLLGAKRKRQHIRIPKHVVDKYLQDRRII